MNGDHIKNLVHDYIDGALSADEMKRVEEHVASCRECRAELSAMMGLVSDLRALPRSIEPPAEVFERIDAAVNEKQAEAAGLDSRRNGMMKDQPARRALRLIPGGWTMRIAASLVLLVAASGIWLLLKEQHPVQPGIASSERAESRTAPPPTESGKGAETARPEQKEKAATEDNARPSVSGSRISAGSAPESVAGRAAARNDADKISTFVDRGAAPKDARAAIAPAVSGDTGSISGRVVDLASNNPIAGARVVIADLGREAVTDSSGRFAFGNLPPGKHDFSAEHAGHAGRTIAGFAVRADRVTPMYIRLEGQSGGLAANSGGTFIDRVGAAKAAPAPATVAENAVQGVPMPDNPGQFTLTNPTDSGGGTTGKIAGKVTDLQTGEKLIGANVVVEGTNRGAVTDMNGAYVIVGIPAGTYSIRIAMVGYNTMRILHAAVAADRTTDLDAKLTPFTAQSFSVGIVAQENAATKSAAESAMKQVEGRGIVGAPPQNGARREADPGARRGSAKSWGYNSRQYPHLYPVPIPPAWNTEKYDHLGENTFRDPQEDPLSTFSIDVDNASYSNVRRFITDGQMPPADAVRVEEMINYFTYDYPEPRGEHPFTVTTEMSDCPWNPEHRLLLIGLQGKHVDADRLPPANLVFLIDVSGSMNMPEKLPLVKSAFRLLVSQLREDDRVAIVTYAGQAGLALPSTSGDQKQRILDVIDRLQAGGSTAGGEGINLAYRIARENFRRGGNNRVILATDGDFNVGVSNDDDLVRLIEEQRSDGITLSVLGFGTGNLKDAKMEKLADHGNGNYAYIDRLEEARKVFLNQMAGTLNTIAKDVKIQIEFNPGRVESYRLVGYENRLLNKEDFNNDAKDAGDLGSGHTVTALYEIVPANRTVSYRDVDTLRYQKVSSAEHADEVLTLKLRYKDPNGSKSKLLTHTLRDRLTERDETSENFRFAAAVAEFGMLLKNSEFKGSARYDDVLSLARGAVGSDKEGYRTGFLHLVESAKMLAR